MASKEVTNSQRLKRVFELVLAMGNYMNHGKRGDAFGFKIASLSKLADTKSSVQTKRSVCKVFGC